MGKVCVYSHSKNLFLRRAARVVLSKIYMAKLMASFLINGQINRVTLYFKSHIE